MRRGLLILMAGGATAAIAYFSFYLAGTATPRALMRSAQPELAWLQHEFNLSDADFARVSQLHKGYLPQCMQRCQRITELNTSLAGKLHAASQVTPEIEQILTERAQMRATCQAEMLKHFFAVSRTMPPEQGKRYLAWVQERTCLHEQAMDHGMDHAAGNASHRE